jgi:hypothetical protein
VAKLPGVRMGLISQDPIEKLDRDVAQALATHVRVENGLSPEQLARATQEVGRRLGGVEKLLGTLEQLQVPLAEVREQLGLPGLYPAQAHAFRDKSRMKEVLMAAGLPCARFRRLHSVEEGVAFAREVGYPLVVKPPDGAGAKATYRARHEAELRAQLGSLHPSPHNPIQAEEFMQGLERSFDVMSIRGVPQWHSLTWYDPACLHVLENPWIQWTVLLPREVDHPAYDDVRAAGFAALKALGMQTGISHMEWFRRPDGSLAISEIGARPPGARIVNLMGWAHDCDMFSKWAECVVYERFSPPPRRYAAGCAYLRGVGEGRIKAVHGIEQAQRDLGHLVVEAELPRVGASPSSSYEGDGWVILRHPETEVVQKALRHLISTVKVELG